MGLLIDSTVFIHAERNHQTPEDLLREVLTRFGDVELALSAMSAGELFHGCRRAQDPSRRARREEFVETILAAISVVPITLSVMRVFGEVDARLSAAGSRIPTSDLLIASTAIAREDDVLTSDVRHFTRIPGLTVHEFR